GRVWLRVGLGHCGGDAVLEAQRLEDGELMLGAAFLDAGTVAEAEIIELPKHLNVEVAARAEPAHLVVEAAAKRACGRGSGRVRRRAAQQDAGDQRPHLLLPQ